MSRFARRVGVCPSTMYRYAYDNVIPGRKYMNRILAATKGAVTPADFYKPTSKAG